MAQGPSGQVDVMAAKFAQSLAHDGFKGELTIMAQTRLVWNLLLIRPPNASHPTVSPSLDVMEGLELGKNIVQ